MENKNYSRIYIYNIWWNFLPDSCFVTCNYVAKVQKYGTDPEVYKTLRYFTIHKDLTSKLSE